MFAKLNLVCCLIRCSVVVVLMVDLGSAASINPENNFKFRVDQTLRIVEHELVILGQSKLLRDIEPKCATELNATFNQCLEDYRERTDTSLLIESINEERLRGCCAIWNYQSCIIDSTRTMAHYSLNICNEDDLRTVEDNIEQTIRNHSSEKQLCGENHQENFYCRDFFESTRFNIGIMSTMFLGFIAIVLCLMLVGYHFFSYLTSVRPIYVAAYTNPCHYDGIELIENYKKADRILFED